MTLFEPRNSAGGVRVLRLVQTHRFGPADRRAVEDGRVRRVERDGGRRPPDQFAHHVDGLAPRELRRTEAVDEHAAHQHTLFLHAPQHRVQP